MLLDRSASTEDFGIDFRVFPERVCRFVRLRIVGAPKGITPAVVDCTLFGNDGNPI